MDLFSSRSRALTPELKALIGQYQKIHGESQSKRTIGLLGRQAAQNARRTKAEARRTVAGQRRRRRTDRRRSGWPPGKPRRRSGKCRPCRRCTSRWPGSPPGTAGVHRRCWTMRPSGTRRGSPSPRCNGAMRCGRWRSSGSRCTGRCPYCRQVPTPRRWSARWPSWPCRGRAGTEVVQVTAPDLSRRDQPGRPGVGRGQHLPATNRRAVLHAGPSGHRTADPHRRAHGPCRSWSRREQARQPSSGRGCSAGQCDAVVTVLTAATATTALVAAAGAGKSHKQYVPFCGWTRRLADCVKSRIERIPVRRMTR